eukprot:3726052-Rhodomonas_salina.2
MMRNKRKKKRPTSRSCRVATGAPVLLQLSGFGPGENGQHGAQSGAKILGRGAEHGCRDAGLRRDHVLWLAGRKGGQEAHGKGSGHREARSAPLTARTLQ